MASLSLPVEAESFARAIYEFQCNTGNKKASWIDSTLQRLVERVAASNLLSSPLLEAPKRKARAVASVSSRFYDPFWLMDTDKFPATVAHFEEIITNSQMMDSSLQQSIISAVTSAVATAVAAIQAKHENEMLALRKMIEKSLLLRESPSATSLPNPDALSKALLAADSLPKATER